MYWFPAPPYLRIAAATLLIAAGLWSELAPTATVAHPFAASDVAAGRPVPVEWRQVPRGLLPPVGDDPVAAHPIAAGEPLVPSALTDDTVDLPAGWWALPLPLPVHVAPGTPVRVVVTTSGLPARSYDGIVVESAAEPSAFDYGPAEALVAVPGSAAEPVAAAAAGGQVTVLVGR